MKVSKTTLPKAKELRKVLEPLITIGKKPTLANKRLAFSRLRDRNNVVKLFSELGPRFENRPGVIREFIKTDLGLAIMHQWRSWNLWRRVRFRVLKNLIVDVTYIGLFF